MGDRVPFFAGILPDDPFTPTGDTGDATANPGPLTADQFLFYAVRAKELLFAFDFVETNPPTFEEFSGSFSYSSTLTLSDTDEVQFWKRIANVGSGFTIWNAGANPPQDFDNPSVGSWTQTDDSGETTTGSYTVSGGMSFVGLLPGNSPGSDEVNILTDGDLSSGNYWPYFGFTLEIGTGDGGGFAAISYFDTGIPLGTLTFSDIGLTIPLYCHNADYGSPYRTLTVTVSATAFWTYATTTGLPVWNASTGAMLNPPDS